jgi:hypothetical protein
MTAAELLVDLATVGVELWVDGDMLRYRGVESSVTAERLALLRERKDEVLQFLANTDDGRVAVARHIFDAEVEDAEARLRPEFEAMPASSGASPAASSATSKSLSVRSAHPAAWRPRDCLAGTLCSVLGPCPRRC